MSQFPPIEWPTNVNVNNQSSLQTAINNARINGINTRITLTSNITLTQPLNVPERASVYLTSNPGGPYTIAAGQGFRVMNVETLDPNESTVVYFGNITVREGTSTADGGAIYGSGPGNAVIVLESGANFQNNTAVNGGAIALTQGAVGVFGGTLTGNSASENGGAIYIAEGHRMAMYGAFSMLGGTSLISLNEAGMSGGGVYVGSTDDVVITGGTISYNHAYGKGGGLYVNKLDFSDGNISINSADAGGGGIYLDGVGNVNGLAHINGNMSLTGGGGIYMSENPDTRLDIEDNVQILGNHAIGAAGGGGIFVTRQMLPALTVGADVRFAGNSAIKGYPNRLPEDDAVYYANIHATQWSAYFIQGYNNYDIRYDNAEPEPAPGCQVEGQQMVDICLPVSVEPFATAGDITTRCCGEAIITPGDVPCQGIPNGKCNFTIRQKVCVNVPVDFGTITTPGEPHILCTDEDCSNCGPNPNEEGGDI